MKRGPWSPAEDLRLISFIQKHGHDNWRSLPKQAGLKRCGKSCRLRWINYLRPDVKRGNFTPEEEEAIIHLHQSIGNKWSRIAAQFPGRTDNEIKNVWNTHLKKKLEPKVTASKKDESKESSVALTSSSSSSNSFKSYDHQTREVVNLENDQLVGDDDQNCQAKKKLKSQSGEATKEPSSPSSNTSYNSNITTTNSSQVEDTKHEELMGSFFNFGAFNHDLPFEFDSDFWNMLDNINTNEAQVSDPNVCQSSSFVPNQELNMEPENRKWLKYVETELELEDTTTTTNEMQKSMTNDAATQTDDNTLLVAEAFDNGQAYFELWPPSPQNFVI